MEQYLYDWSDLLQKISELIPDPNEEDTSYIGHNVR